jgi:hypothetical protein
MNVLLGFVILAVPAAIVMGIVRLLGVTNQWLLLLGAMIGGGLAGAFIGSAASAMATAVNSQVAALRAGGIGLGAGLVVGGLILWAASIIAQWRG